MDIHTIGIDLGDDLPFGWSEREGRSGGAKKVFTKAIAALHCEPKGISDEWRRPWRTLHTARVSCDPNLDRLGTNPPYKIEVAVAIDSRHLDRLGTADV